MRIAWWSPWPPQRSGVAGRSAELVPLLAARDHAIDVFVDARRVPAAPAADHFPAPGEWRVLDAHDFIWRHTKGYYDLTVYQVGNSHLHRYLWPYLFRYPGLAVVHDARVHHARAEALLSAGRTADYRAEFAWSHPDVDPAAATFAAMGVDGVFFYQWPMLRAVLETSRVVAPHSAGVAAALRQEWPHVPIEHIALGEGRADLDVAEARREVRAAQGLPTDAVVFGVFGGLTVEKHLHEILDAFRATRAWVPDARLLLAGAEDPWLDLDERIRSLQLSDAVSRVVAVRDEDFDRAIASVDVVLNLRWPTALETSGPWVRSLALGRATVIIDLPHQSHAPTLDPRTWRRHAPCADLEPDADDRAIAVALDVCDLSHSLRKAMRQLATDAPLRDRLGAAARRWWAREHAMSRMVADYERAMARAAAQAAPSPAADWPSHLVADPAAHVRRLLAADVWRTPSVAARLSGLGS